MTDQELLDIIKKSAESVEIPRMVLPEEVKKRLMDEKTNKTKGTEKNRNYRYAGKYVAAAAITVICVAGAFGIYSGRTSRESNTAGEAGMLSADNGASAGTGGIRAGKDTDPVTEEEKGASGGAESSQESDRMDSTDPVTRQKHNAGDLYVVASDYGKVYDAIKKSELNMYRQEMKWAADMDSGGKMINESAGISEDAGTGDAMSPISSSATKGEAGAIAAGDTDQKYSKTNLQTEGVDESDIIKTDGSYLYIVDDSSVKLVDVRKKEMKLTGEITLSMNSAADSVMEMYVDGNILNVIVQKEVSALKKENTNEAEDAADIYSFDSDWSTELLTYDISDRENPVLKGTVKQDGMYNTSRKTGDIVYLFTEKGVQRPELTKSTAILEDNIEGWIPLVNGKAIAADCIYIPSQGNQGLLISSVDTGHPDQIVDNTLIINQDVQIYMSTDALYLYSQSDSVDGMTTQIAKFKLQNGTIDAVGATSAAGFVRDTFAINEYQGKLRLLTTDLSGGQEQNNLFLFDGELKLTGKLTGIAQGEEIYAARYFNDMAYFVTYRNTDPLFAVDLSDETNPVILSELKITGFSEYLHFWGSDKLVGIGYETDPDSGERKGLKLSMFDISDPADLKTAGTCVIENLDYSPALYDYKCVLVDEKENIIGFAAESYRRGSCSYFLFSWENGKFREVMTESLEDTTDLQQYRGIYIDDRFYLAGIKNVISYDRKDEYRMIQKLEL